VFVACSTRSTDARKRPAEVGSADAVLNVEHIAQRSMKLGRSVTLVRIRDGIHDLTLSAEPARTEFFEELSRWEKAYIPR
jgi:alpha-beta hydrolase superfamily lysophospholipase